LSKTYQEQKTPKSQYKKFEYDSKPIKSILKDISVIEKTNKSKNDRLLKMILEDKIKI
jgi:hypothetical protein